MRGVTIRGPIDFFNPTLPSGAANPFFVLVTWANSRGVFVRREGDEGVMEGFTDLEYLSLEVVKQVVEQAGGDVEGYPVFLEIPEANYEDTVVLTLPGATIQDADGNTTVRRWSEYKRPGNTHVLKDGVYHIKGSSMGRHLTGKEIVNAMNAGVTVKPISEWPRSEGLL